MEINTADLQSQLNSIVNSTPQPAPEAPKKVEASAPEVKAAAPDLAKIEMGQYNVAVNEGKELEFLQTRVEAMNGLFDDLSVDVSYKIEKVDVGGYVVSIVDDSGNVIKTIPGDTFIETRAKIREELKGLIEDGNS